MSPEQSRRVDEIFEEIVDLPEAEQQQRIDRDCGGDQELKAAVLELLSADAAAHPLLNLNVSSFAGELLDLPEQDTSLPGRVDRYLIRGPLGQGGMGAVYLAEREGLGDRVAIKVLRHAWSSLEDRRRFDFEQRVLASLNHRHIARLYDAGLFDGRQWFAMEFVEGVPITEYCKRNRCSLRERLRLFRAACEAVSYAHGMLIVHRDLKPSNILVSAGGEVKLVDFGIAKHLDPSQGGAGKTTAGSVRLSLNYSSPEQIRGEADSLLFDVYALGVVLCELLTGSPPADLGNASAMELARWLEEDMEPPSVTRRKAIEEKLDAPIEATASQWKDLDLLCLTACSKQRQNRYRSVEDLIRDVDHFLNQEPLDVHPKSLRYRLHKFYSRNRRAVVAGSVTVAALFVIVAFFSWRLLLERNRAIASQTRTERIHQLMLNLFEGDDEAAGPPDSLRVVTLLDRGALAAKHLNNTPALQIDLQSTIGDLYHKLGRLEESEPLLREVYAREVAQLGALHPDTIRAEIALSLLLLDRNKKDEAAKLSTDALSRAKQRPSSERRLLADALAGAGKVASERGDYAQAVPFLEEAVKLYSEYPPTAALSEALTTLANTEYYRGRFDVAESLNRRLLEMDRRLFGEAHPNVGIDLFNLGNIAMDHAQYLQAESLMKQSLQICQAWYGTQHPRTANALVMLGQAEDYLGHTRDAADLYQQSLDIYIKVFGNDHERVAQVVNYQGLLAMKTGRLDEAATDFRRAGEIFEKSNYGHEFYAHELSNLAEVNRRQRNYARAEELLRDALARLMSSVPDSRYMGIAQTRMANTLLDERRYRDAEQYALAGYQTLKKLGASSDLEGARQALLQLYAALHETEKAQLYTQR